jgi:hypothetical protein
VGQKLARLSKSNGRLGKSTFYGRFKHVEIVALLTSVEIGRFGGFSRPRGTVAAILVASKNSASPHSGLTSDKRYWRVFF